ncbi:hypothetical protein MIND_01159900 [Mycena indigotica]|uniref:Uncharacterized protein n=1 Tax=Mycena indigotica TaxID=2126181 RepID=A0A8H6S5J3_9AGAR|nr:uncharacterized protein MIND_01159900 [Mycena indigotica]KAF7292620.1 hypothetical protein MIND_01159900 [Mycena indigotica]
MPPKKKPESNPHFRPHPTDPELTQCIPCEFFGLQGKEYTKKSGIRKHISTPAHISCVTRFAEKAQEAAKAEKSRNLSIQNAYMAPPLIHPAQSNSSTSPLSRLPMISAEPPELLDHNMADFQFIAQGLAQNDVEQRAQDESDTPALDLQQEFERILAEALSHTETEDGEDEEFEQLLTEEDDEGIVEPDPLCAPYPNRTVMLLDVIDNLARCRFTGVQMLLVLKLLKCLGAHDIPTLKSLRKIQKQIHTEVGNTPTKITTAFGNVFYINDIRDSIARDFANPLVAPHLHLYPEEVLGGPVLERWQAERIFEYTPDQLTPMYSNGNRRYWINEVAQLKDGQFVIPTTWIIRNGRLTSNVLLVSRNADSSWDCSGRELRIDALDLSANFDDMVDEYGANLTWSDRSQAFVVAMPNPQRQLFGNRDLYVVGLSNTAVPGRLLKQEFHIHFMAASQNVSTTEFSAALRDSIKATETNPIVCYNAESGQEAALILRLHHKDGDNPQRSEEASHIGCHANKPCRKCKWGGSQKEKETAATYHAAHAPGIARTAAEIRVDL